MYNLDYSEEKDLWLFKKGWARYMYKGETLYLLKGNILFNQEDAIVQQMKMEMN